MVLIQAIIFKKSNLKLNSNNIDGKQTLYVLTLIWLL